MSTIRKFWAPGNIKQRNFDQFGLNKGARVAAQNAANAASMQLPISLNRPLPYASSEFDGGFFGAVYVSGMEELPPIEGLLG
jgi:hypothetical protein